MIERETISPNGAVRYRAVKGWGAFWRTNIESRLTEPAEITDYVWLADRTGVFFTTEKSASILRWSPEVSVNTIPFQTPMGNDGHVLVESPTQDVIAVGWWNQCESGIELIDVNANDLCHRASGALEFPEETNGISIPVISADGNLIAVGFTKYGWWVEWPDSDLDIYADASPGGEFLAAWIVVGNTRSSEWLPPVKIRVSVTEGWKPDEGDEDLLSYALISSMKLLNDQLLQVELLNIGRIQIYFNQIKRYTVDITS